MLTLSEAVVELDDRLVCCYLNDIGTQFIRAAVRDVALAVADMSRGKDRKSVV